MFKTHGQSTRRERWTLILGVPLVLVLLGFEIMRIWRAIQGEPLLITGLADFDITVRWSANPLYFILGVIFHSVIILILVGLLWAQFEQGRTWLKSKRR